MGDILFLLGLLNANRLKNNAVIAIVFLISLTHNSCRQDRIFDQGTNKTPKHSRLYSKLIENPLIPLNSEFSVFIDTDTLYLLNFLPDREATLRFQFHIVNEDGTFINQDFDPQKFIVTPEKTKELIGIKIRKIPLPNKFFNHIRLGQYSRQAGRIEKKWQSNVSRNQLLGNGKQRCENRISDKQKILYQKIFQQHLDEGVFVEVQYGINVLFRGKKIWLITQNNSQETPNFMLHLIKENGDFDNLSFSVKESTFTECLGLHLNDRYITLLNLEKDYEYYNSIRIGQFNNNGNLWAETLKIDRLSENVLLRYQGEFD
jgi:hypothetical protein